jgi:UDP-2,3-diacylglucosamine hydrolase
MALYIFSDAHLGSGPPDKEVEKAKQIERLFELVRADGDRLVILGDLFDFWFEYKHAIPKDQHRVLFLLYGLRERGITIDYLGGNHDFWMHDFFEKQMGINVHQDSIDMEYAGKKLHLIHGDGIAKADGGYRFLKRILRNRLNIWLYRKLTPDWAIPLAKSFSRSSQQYTARREHSFASDYEEYARTKIEDGYHLVAIGHLHVPVKRDFPGGIYINTGDFINHFSYAKVTEKETCLSFLNQTKLL